MNQAFSYIRFSTGKQTKGSSHERQKAMVDSWIDSHPQYTLNPLTFEDLGISGRSGKHLKNGFGKLLEAIEKGGIGPGDVVLVEAIDRAGRMEPAKMLNILTGIVLAGVTIVTLDDGQWYSGETMKGGSVYVLAGKIQAAFNYSQSLSDRMKASYAARNKLAKTQNVTPKRNTPVWLTSDGALIDEVAPFVIQAFEDYASGLGERRIYERILEAGGSKYECFVRMAPSTVKRWMRNRTAIGEWQGIPNVYPAVVTPELFYRVQKKLAEKNIPRAAPTKHKYTGLVACGVCGKNFNTKVYAPRKDGVTPPPVMECSSRARRGANGCSNSKGIPYAVVSLAVQQSCWKHVNDALAGQYLTESQKREVEIDGQISDIGVKISRLVPKLAELDDIDEVADLLRELKAQRKALLEEKATLVHDSATIKERITNSLDLMTDPLKANAMLQSVGFKIVCNPDGAIDTPVGRFVYEGWARSDDTHKVLTPEGKLYRLPIHRDGEGPKVDESVSVKIDLSKLDRVTLTSK
ncbi:recombinase family protein [Pseudomonas asiatica]|uniref:recombinase family protein n=1 Tax=Pseudomonas asiatica TaxID=2219225 RepID=UPI0025A06FB6|nr:recombinase family protein [Pseudomonas asiatica]WJM55316.1 recombinase family protein [Pseudomonas asiatica]